MITFTACGYFYTWSLLQHVVTFIGKAGSGRGREEAEGRGRGSSKDTGKSSLPSTIFMSIYDIKN